MAVFLLILKIIGIVLLSIIGVVLFIILYLLLAPFPFMVSGIFNEQVSVKGYVKSFLHFLLVDINWDKDNGFDLQVSIFGKFLKVYPSKKKSKDAEDDTDESAVTKDDIIDNGYMFEDETEDIDYGFADDTSSKRKLKKDRNKSSNAKNKFSFEKFEQKIEEISEKIKKFCRMVTDDGNKDALKLVLRELKRILRSFHLNLRGTDIDFGIADPDVTGLICACLSVIPAIYDKRVHINPDFNTFEPYANGNINLKGRIYLIVVLYSILAVYFDKNCKKIINLIGGK